MGTTPRLRRVAMGAALLLAISACSGNEAEDATEAPEAGVAVPAELTAEVPLYSPEGYDALLYALPTAVSGRPLVASPAEILSADEDELAADLLIKRYLVEKGLAPSVISIAQRGTNHEAVPDVSVTAVQFKGLPAEDFAGFVPSVYLLATSVTVDQYKLTGAKPARYPTEIEGRDVQASDWGDFDLVWYPHGDVVFIVLAANEQLLSSALRALPPFPGVG